MLLVVGAAVAILIAAIGAGQWLSSYRAASAAQGCGSLEAGALPQAKAIRSIRLDQRWTNGGAGTLCVAGIRVYDGSFEIISYAEGPSSLAQPWTASHAGRTLGLLFDDRGRTFPGGSRGGGAGADANLRIDTYGTIVIPTQRVPPADLLAGVHELHLKVEHVLQAVRGPWRFDAIHAKSGALSASATAAGRDLHLYDLVVRPDGFSVAYLPLGEVVTGTVVVTDQPTIRDDRGTTYQSAGLERVGSSANLYAKFTPAPPADATLTVEIPTIYVSSNESWDGKLTLP